MSGIETFSIASSIASIVLAAVAIWQATFFYTKSKSTEQNITNALCEIKSQTETLSKLNTRFMDRLIKAVTENRPTEANESTHKLVSALENLPQAIAMQITRPGNDKSEELLIDILT